MNLNLQQLLEHLKDDEGFRPFAYEDSRGYLTIGHGICVDSRVAGAGITEEESEWLLANRAVKSIEDLDKRLPWWRNLDPVRQLVLADMCYNMGIVKLSKFHKTLAAAQAGDWLKAAVEMQDSLWYEQTKRRAVRLVKMMHTGIDPGPQ